MFAPEDDALAPDEVLAPELVPPELLPPPELEVPPPELEVVLASSPAAGSSSPHACSVVNAEARHKAATRHEREKVMRATIADSDEVSARQEFPL